jgi:hypothetical protein
MSLDWKRTKTIQLGLYVSYHIIIIIVRCYLNRSYESFVAIITEDAYKLRLSVSEIGIITNIYLSYRTHLLLIVFSISYCKSVSLQMAQNSIGGDLVVY